MKLNFTVEIDKYDEVYELEEELLVKASEKFIESVLGNSWDRTDLYGRLEKRVIAKLEEIMDVDFKSSVADKVTTNLTKKFEKTKQYKELLHGEEVITDSVIKSGLKDLVAEIVRSEMKKVFK
jgi:hypothetical protein